MRTLVTATLAAIIALSINVGPSDLNAQTKAKDTTKKSAPDEAKTKQPATAGVVIELYKDNAGEFRFRIKEGDTLLATSGKGYDSKDDALKVIATLKRQLATAKTDDQSDRPVEKKADKKMEKKTEKKSDKGN